MSDAATPVAETVQQALAGLDVEAVRRTYWDQNEFVYLERWLPAGLIDRMLVRGRAGPPGHQPELHSRATRRAAA